MKANERTKRQLPNTDSQANKTEKTERRHNESASTRRISTEGGREQDAFVRRRSESASTSRISAEGSPSSRQLRAVPQRELFGTQDLCKEFTASNTSSHDATARARQHAHLRRGSQATFARHHSESASTRTISAKGPLSSRNACR